MSRIFERKLGIQLRDPSSAEVLAELNERRAAHEKNLRNKPEKTFAEYLREKEGSSQTPISETSSEGAEAKQAKTVERSLAFKVHETPMNSSLQAGTSSVGWPKIHPGAKLFLKA